MSVPEVESSSRTADNLPLRGLVNLQVAKILMSSCAILNVMGLGNVLVSFTVSEASIQHTCVRVLQHGQVRCVKST